MDIYGTPTFTDIFPYDTGNQICGSPAIGDIDNDGDLAFYIPNADQANRMIISLFAESGEVKFKDITIDSKTSSATTAPNFAPPS